MKMIAINKSEAKQLREMLPQAHIIRTMKQKSKRGRYFCEEVKLVVDALREIRSSGATDGNE